MYYQNLLIFYFSGIGNAKNIANWIFQESQTKEINRQLLNIETIDKIEILEKI